MRSEALRWIIRGVGLATGVAIVLMVAYVAAAAAGVLILVFVAVLLASGLEPVIGWLRAHLGLPRAWTVLLVYAAFIVVVAVLALLVAPAVLDQAGATVAAIPAMLDRTEAWAHGLQPPFLANAVHALIGAGRGLLLRLPPTSPSSIVQTSVTVAQSVVSLVTLLVVVFFWLVEHARLQRYVLAFVPFERRPGARDAWNRVESRLGLWVRGQLTIMAALALATGVVYSILGVPAALLLAVIAGLCEVIPLVGPLLGAIPAVIVALTVGPELALAVAVAYVILQVLEGNVLVPLIMRNAVGLSPFLVLVSILVGAAAGGIVGAFVAVPIAAALEVILEPLQARDLPVAAEPRDGASLEGTESSLDSP